MEIGISSLIGEAITGGLNKECSEFFSPRFASFDRVLPDPLEVDPEEFAEWDTEPIEIIENGETLKFSAEFFTDFIGILHYQVMIDAY